MNKDFNIDALVRENVKRLKPYRSAREEFQGVAAIHLDANESPIGDGLNRYPDPYQREVKNRMAEIQGVDSSQIFLGNGSDEVIDLLIRAFCEPGRDEVLLFPPTYGMYEISAEINAVKTVKVPLKENFQIDLEKALKPRAKLTFICSPNNPTGNDIDYPVVEELLKNSSGIVVIDEAYIDFSSRKSWTERLDEFPNLVVMQTLSKAYALAGIRLGQAFAGREVVEILNKIKPPYNVNALTQQKALEALSNADGTLEQIDLILRERSRLIEDLQKISGVEKIYPSEANFLLVRMDSASALYEHLASKGVVVRNRSNLVESCLRITVGSPEENRILLENINDFYA
jgi:histidinol-phosphate aminotransferase